MNPLKPRLFSTWMTENIQRQFKATVIINIDIFLQYQPALTFSLWTPHQQHQQPLDDYKEHHRPPPQIMNVGMTKRRHPPSKCTARCSVNNTATGCSQATVRPLQFPHVRHYSSAPLFFGVIVNGKIENRSKGILVRRTWRGDRGWALEEVREREKCRKYSVRKIKLISSVGIRDVWTAPERCRLPLSSDPTTQKKKKIKLPVQLGDKADPNTINLTNQQIFIQVLQREHSCFPLTNKINLRREDSFKGFVGVGFKVNKSRGSRTLTKWEALARKHRPALHPLLWINYYCCRSSCITWTL